MAIRHEQRRQTAELIGLHIRTRQNADNTVAILCVFDVDMGDARVRAFGEDLLTLLGDADGGDPGLRMPAGTLMLGE